jgi:hypothetical protein
MTNKQAVARFEYLANMIGKYAHRWSENTSDRLNGWVYEYNQLRDSHYDAFLQYCEKNQYSTKHDAYDCLA